MTTKQLVERSQRLAEEVERLKKVTNISDSIAQLPTFCLDDLKTSDDIEKARASALDSALD